MIFNARELKQIRRLGDDVTQAALLARPPLVPSRLSR